MNFVSRCKFPRNSGWAINCCAEWSMYTTSLSAFEEFNVSSIPGTSSSRSVKKVAFSRISQNLKPVRGIYCRSGGG